jgi:hypothetical protein
VLLTHLPLVCDECLRGGGALLRAVAIAVTTLSVCSGPTWAQESPDELTRRETGCQLTTARRVLRYAADSARCYEQCQLGRDAASPRSCDSFEPDAITQRCLDRARRRAARPVRRRCGGAACPECYLGGQCGSFLDTWLGNADILAASAQATIYCDDDASADGTTPGEVECRDRTAAAGFHLGRNVRRCVMRCRQRRRSESKAAGSCDLGDVDGPLFDPSTQACIDRARTRFLGACDACTDPPECWAGGLPLGCVSAGELFTLPATALSSELFCVDAPVCGDGIVAATEACDPGATPDDCAAGTFCDAACTCQVLPDRCAAPTIISSLGGTASGARTGPSTMVASCGGSGPEQVFTWTPQASGTATVKACLGDTVTQVSVREGACDAPAAEIACAADACAGGAGLSLEVTAGTTYYLVVDGVGEGIFLLSVTPPPSPPPLCSTARAVVTLDFAPPPGDSVVVADAALHFPGPKLAHVPPATNLASPEGAFLSWSLADADPVDGFDDRLDVALVDLFGSVPPGDFAAADFTCRPGASLPTADELACTGRISTDPVGGGFVTVPCSVTSFTVTPPG